MQTQKTDIHKIILEVSRKEFLMHGFKDTSMRTIAKKSGVSLSNIYNYFKDKDEILQAVLQSLINYLSKIQTEHNDTNKITLDMFYSDEFQRNNIQNFVGMVKQYREELNLLLFNAHGSKLENYKEELIDNHTRLGLNFLEKMKKKYSTVKFDFLGYSFQPRSANSKKTGKLFLGYDCAISISSRKRIADKLGELEVEKLSFKSIVGIAQYLNPMIRRWVNYYGRFRGYELSKVFQLLRKRLVRWARKRYKLQNKSKSSLQVVRKGKASISLPVLPLAGGIFLIFVVDLYNKSRVSENFQARFCERLGVKLPLST